MKRKICSIIALSMIMATISVPKVVTAEEVNFNDTIVTKPENLMVNPTNGSVFGYTTNDNVIKKENNLDSWNGTGVDGYFLEATGTTASSDSRAGYGYLNGVRMTNGSNSISSTLTTGKNYVFSFLARNAGTTDSVALNVAMGDYQNRDNGANFTIEKGEAGYTVTDDEEWTEIAGTIEAPADDVVLTIGFPAGTTSGTKLEFNLAYQPEKEIYLAEEVAYELDITCEDTEFVTGDTISVSAELLNQIGTTGALSQEFDWYVVDEDRTEEVTGFSISATDDAAEITVGDSVETGNYVIVAVSSENEMVKGIEIAVENTVDDDDTDDEGGVVDFNDTTVTKPTNMMTDPNKGEVFGNPNSNTVTKNYNYDSGWNSTYGTYNGYMFTATSDVVASGAEYANVGGFTTAAIDGGSGGLYGKTLVKDKAYVVSFLARNVGTTESFKVNMGLTDSATTWAPTYTLEKGEDGYVVAEDTEWTKIAGTIVAPCASPFLSVGFMEGEESGSAMEINLAYQPDDAIYFAEEVAYELNVTCEDTEVVTGDTISVSAELLNQVGTTGSLSQEFDWYVVNEDRTEEVTGFSISATDDAAEITVGDNVEAGNYVIVAVSSENEMVKGVEIAVENTVDDDTDDEGGVVDFNDTTVTKPANMMTEPNKGDVFGSLNVPTENNGSVTKSYNTDSGWNGDYSTYNGYLIKAESTVVSQGASYSNVGGITITDSTGGLNGKSLEAGKAYVVSFLARNIGTTDSFKVNMGLTDSVTTWAPTYTLEKGTEGYVVEEDTDWTKIAGTIVAPCASPFLSIGFMDGEAQGSVMEFNLAYQPDDAIYFAEEVAYELNVTCEDTEVVTGDTISVSAELLNQVGTTGSLSQEFDWYVVNEDRTEEVTGFSISATDDAAEITVGDSVEAGNYVIVAVSSENEMVKGVEIAVGNTGDDNTGDEGEIGDYSDATIEVPRNMMTDPNKGDVFGSLNVPTENNGSVTKSYNYESPWNGDYSTYNGYLIKAESTVVSQGAPYSNVGGITITDRSGGLNGKSLEAGQAYVVSFLARNIGTTDSFKVNMGLTDSVTTWAPTYTLEKGTEGYVVEEDIDWTKIAGTIVAPCASPFLSIGFMDGEAQGSVMEFNLAYQPDDAIYFAEEIPYVMEVTHEGESLVDAGSTMLFTTKVTNQIGTTGNLVQDANYYVVNEERTMKVSGFSFADADGKELMTISDDVEPGYYYVVAENIDNPAVRKGVKIQVQRPYQADYEPDDNASAGEIHDITVEIEDEQATYTFLDSLTLSAAILDIDDIEVDGAQNFEWKAYKENRRDEEENIIVTESDATSAVVSFTSAIENGTYYILARSVSSDNIQRAVKIVINNSSAYSLIAAEINSLTKEDIEANIDTYAEYADIPEDIYDLVDKATLSAVLEKTELSADNIKKDMIAACIVSLYVSNPQSVLLNNSEDLSFVYADELGFSDLAQSGVTLMSLYQNSLSQEQRSNVMSVVNSLGIVSPKVFVEKLCESIILEGIQESESTLGSGYVLDFVTEANLAAADINKGKFTSSKANSYAALIVGKTLTKSELERILATTITTNNPQNGGSPDSVDSTDGTGALIYNPTSSSLIGQSMFADVSEDHWAFKQIDFLRKQNIISGKDANNFYPNDYLTREELTRIIVSAFKLTDTGNEISFDDVVEGAWYEDSIRIASSNGIIKGISETSFGVGDNITRQDLCVMIARALGKNETAGAEMSFTDKDEISDYAVNAVSYLNMICVVNGYVDNTFRPKDLCTRAEAAKIIGDILNYEVKEVE